MENCVEKMNIVYLTYAANCQQSRRVFWWFARREERFHYVHAEGKGYYSLRAGPYYHAFDPEPYEC